MQVNIRKLAFAAMLAAMSAVLIGPLAIKLNLFGGYMKNISFGCVPVLFAGAMLGPRYGALTGAVADIGSYLIAPSGAYFPGFTITYALCGMIAGIMLNKNGDMPSYPRVLLSSAAAYVSSFTILNSLILVLFFGLSPQVIFIRALIQCAMLPVFALLVKLLLAATRSFRPMLQGGQ